MSAAGAAGFDPVSVIAAKRDGQELTGGQIDAAIAAYTSGRMAEEQMAALLMAVYLRGMTAAETVRWTAAMTDSGARLDFTDLRRAGRALPAVDKHSTGGVGDTVTVMLAPLVAACGAAVPQLSGRGLGHTGGTLDKLEAIPGWRAEVPADRMREILRESGAVVCAAGADLAPADRKMYALRDVTGTVESIPLIAASIMSKKIAEGAGALVLDVKVGRGAFMTDLPRARELAETMVELGARAGLPTTALLSGMDVPLGYAVGNAVEIAEAVEVLAGGGPADLAGLTVTLAVEMLAAAGITDVDPAAVLASGGAMDSYRAMIRAQGGDPDADLPRPRQRETVRAGGAGTVTDIDALGVGRAAWLLGAGRRVPGQQVDPVAGVVLGVRLGDAVVAGQELAVLHTGATGDDARERIAAASAELERALTVTPPGTAPGPGPTHLGVLDRIGAESAP